jgi:multidrug efflux pump subunit AcrB
MNSMAQVWLFFTEKRALSYLLIVAIVIFGIGSVFSIQKESAPEVQVPVAIITSTLPGATPEDVEELIVRTIEQEVLNLENVKKVTGTAREGVGSVTVEFEASADIRTAIQDTKDAVDIARGELPADATEPIVSEVNFADQPIVFISLASNLSLTEFETLTKQVQDAIERMSGVSRVETSGMPEREIRVILEPEILALQQLDITRMVQTIRNENISSPVGNLEIGGVEYPLDLAGSLESADDVGSVIVQTGTNTSLPLGNIAFIGDGFADQQALSRVSIAGSIPQQSIGLVVYKQSGADVTSISTSVKEYIAMHNIAYPDAPLSITYDAGQQIIDDLSRLTITGMQTVLLVMLVLFIALGWREALIASLSIPLSFLTAIALMQITGNTINFISLFSLILAIGILVDTAIVVTEALHTNLKNGMSPYTAVRTAIIDFHYPITTGNLTTIAVFVPLFTISGVTGEFIAGIPFTIIAVLVSSLAISLAIIPLIGSRLLRSDNAQQATPMRDKAAEHLRAWYLNYMPALLDYRNRKRWFVFSVILLLIALMILPFFGIIKVSFFPQGDVDYLYVNIEEPQGAPLSRTNMSAHTIEMLLRDIPEIASFTTTVGREATFDQSARSGGRFASIDITLHQERARTSSEVLQDIQQRLSTQPEITTRASQPSDGPPTGAPIRITFSGNDLTLLKQTAQRAQHTLAEIPGTTNIRSSNDESATGITFSLERAYAGELGVSASTIASTLRTAVYGTEATTITRDGEDVPVVVTVALNPEWQTTHDTNRATPNSVYELPIQTAQGGTVPLGTLLRTELSASSDVISREDGERIVSISSELIEGANAREVSVAFAQAARETSIVPDSITMSIGGETEDVDQSFRDMFRALGIAMVLVFGVLVLQFNSFKQALIVLTTVPLSLIGVLLGLLITGEYLSFPSMLGFIALSGVVVNNAIILVDVWNKMRAEDPDMPLRAVVLRGGAMRLRPILLTSITTIVGIFPLLFASDLWRPIGVAIIFGLAFAVVLTLALVPVLYLKWCKRV